MIIACPVSSLLICLGTLSTALLLAVVGHLEQGINQ